MSQNERSLSITLMVGLWMIVGVVTILLGSLFIIKTIQLISSVESVMETMAYQFRLFIVLLITIFYAVSSFSLGFGFWNLKNNTWKRSLILSIFTGIVCVLQLPQTFVFSHNIMRFYMPEEALFIIDIFFTSLIVISAGIFVGTLLLRDYFQPR
ncbi:MAG: hypothetical protein ACXAC8_02245 [Candidatus Hodarchaeales archaeon]|jgi:hypothetical protein